MSVEQAELVDLVSLDPKSDRVILTISDHLDWFDTIEHQKTLQRKFNAYLAFIESGELVQQYPAAKGRSVALRVVFKYKPDKGGRSFLGRARQIIESAGFTLRDELFAESWNN